MNILSNMKEYNVTFTDKGKTKRDTFHAFSNNEAATRAKERYGKHINIGAIVEIKK